MINVLYPFLLCIEFSKCESLNQWKNHLNFYQREKVLAVGTFAVFHKVIHGRPRVFRGSSVAFFRGLPQVFCALPQVFRGSPVAFFRESSVVFQDFLRGPNSLPRFSPWSFVVSYSFPHWPPRSSAGLPWFTTASSVVFSETSAVFQGPPRFSASFRSLQWDHTRSSGRPTAKLSTIEELLIKLSWSSKTYLGV